MSLSQTTLAASLAGALLLSGCCGGYSVVRTTAHERAGVREGGELVSGEAAVLHYSRLGEPPNTCGSGAQYTEDLWIQLPSLAAGHRFAVGTPGSIAAYQREQPSGKVRAKSVTGTVWIKNRSADGVAAAIQIEIRLPSGEIVKLDDDYDFHPTGRGDSGGPSALP